MFELGGIPFFHVRLFIICILLRLGNSKDPTARCLSQAKNCTDGRIRHNGGIREVRSVFQDALFHYCLDLMGCEGGKQQICHTVGKSEQDYSEPNLRRRLIRQCGLWKIPVRNARAGEALGHYQYLRDSKH